MDNIVIGPLLTSTFAPQIVLIIAIVVILLVDLFKENVERVNITLLALLGLAIAYVSVLWISPSEERGFMGLVIRDELSILLDKLFLMGAALIVLLSYRFIRRFEKTFAEYTVLLLTATLGMMCISVSADLILIFIGIELVSLCLYVLTGFDKKSVMSGEASMKYFLLGAFSTGFLVYGMAFVFGVCRSTNLIEISQTLTPNTAGSPLLVLGFGLILVGLGFKIALTPFHMWAPDVYQGAPTPITAWIASGSKMAGFIALVRIFSMPGESFAPLAEFWVPAIWILSMLTMIVGNAGALVQTDLKRLLAYSSIAHGGYLSMAFVSHNEIGLQALLFYLAAYLFMTIGSFGVVFALSRNGEEVKFISDLNGLAKKRPWMAGMMALFMLSLAGMPPTVGFVGKVWLFGAAIKSGFYLLAVIGILTTLLSFYYYLRVVMAMWMNEPTEGVEFDETPLANSLAVAISAFAVILLGIVPNIIMKVIASGTGNV